MTRRVVVTKDSEALQAQAARLFVESSRQAIEAHGSFRVALSGGNTPRPVYELLASAPARDEVDWSKVQVFFSDERFVPPDSNESNFHMANEALLSRVPIPERFVHRFATVDISPEQSAMIYEENVRRVFEVGLDQTPAFDLLFLGMGEDGHTASLFPGTDALNVTDRLVVANHVGQLDNWRLTFTFPLLNAGSCVAFLVEGEGKAGRVAEVLSGSELPASKVNPVEGSLIWLLDEAAASQLSADLRSES